MSFHQQLANPPGTADHDPNHQGFRNPMAADDTAKQCRERVLRSLDDEARYPANFIRFCTFCGHPLLKSEDDCWDCSAGKRVHFP